MHVDNQIRDGHIIMFVKKKGEILINWHTLKKKFKNCLKLFLKILQNFSILATLHLCIKSDTKNEHTYCWFTINVQISFAANPGFVPKELINILSMSNIQEFIFSTYLYLYGSRGGHRKKVRGVKDLFKTNKFIIRNKNACLRRFFFELKDSNRVKIND